MVMQSNQQTPATAKIDPAGRLTVLIVDDSKVIRLALSKILREEFDVLQAADGEQAWSLLSENKNISAVFSDLSMPNLDGYGLLDRIRASNESYYAELPFIVITGNDETTELLSKVRTKGGNDLVTKPFKTDEIKACIARYLKDEVIDESQDAASHIHVVAEEQADVVNDLQVESILGLDDQNMYITDASDEISHAAPVVETGENRIEEVAANTSGSSESFLDFTFDIDFDMADESPAEEEAELPKTSFEAAELNVNFESDDKADKDLSGFDPDIEQELALDAFDFDEALSSAQPGSMCLVDEVQDTVANDSIEHIQEIADISPDETESVIADDLAATSGSPNLHLEEYETGSLSKEELEKRARETEQIRQALEEIRVREGYHDDTDGSGLLKKIGMPFTTIFSRITALFRRKK